MRRYRGAGQRFHALPGHSAQHLCCGAAANEKARCRTMQSHEQRQRAQVAHMIIGNVPMTVESAAPSPLAVPKSGPLWAAAGWALPEPRQHQYRAQRTCDQDTPQQQYILHGEWRCIGGRVWAGIHPAMGGPCSGTAAAAARASRSAVSFAFSDSNSSCEKMPSSSSAFASRSPCKNAPSILLPSLPSPPPFLSQ